MLTSAFTAASPPLPPPIVNVTSVILSLRTLRIKFNTTYQLNSTILPTNATNKSLTWSSSNTRILTVSNTGLVRSINYGTATVRVTSVSNPTKYTSISITVIR